MTDITPLTDTSRPLPLLLRELADTATDGRVTIHADTVRAWADEIERTRNHVEAARRLIIAYYHNNEQKHVMAADAELFESLWGRKPD